MPERLNWLILAASAATTAACLWLASHAPWWGALPAAMAFALLNNTPFALMHESVHGVGAATPRRNYVLGLIASWMFPTSVSMQRTAHLGHHARNRTDQELYDYYLPHESRLVRNVWLYGGSQAAIMKSISEGRNGRMPAHGEFLGEAKVHLLTAYIYSLSNKEMKAAK